MKRITIIVTALVAALMWATAAFAAPLPGPNPDHSKGLCSVVISYGRMMAHYGWMMYSTVVCHEPGITHINITGIITSTGGKLPRATSGNMVPNPVPGQIYALSVYGALLRPGQIKGHVGVSIFQNNNGCMVVTHVDAHADWKQQNAT